MCYLTRLSDRASDGWKRAAAIVTSDVADGAVSPVRAVPGCRYGPSATRDRRTSGAFVVGVVLDSATGLPRLPFSPQHFDYVQCDGKEQQPSSEREEPWPRRRIRPQCNPQNYDAQHRQYRKPDF